MATVNKASLRTEFDALKARFESLCACCFPLYLVRSPSDLTGLFGRRIS